MARYSFDGSEAQRRREALGLKREHVALGIERCTESVTSYEIGRVTPPLRVVSALCEVLECQPADLFRPVGEMKAVGA